MPSHQGDRGGAGMNAKEKAREIWDKVSAWGKERIGDISLMESLELALEPKKKQAILDEERVYAESIIAAALAELAPPIDASVERVAQDIQDLFLMFGNETPIEDVEKLIAARDAEIIAGTKQAQAAALAEKDAEIARMRDELSDAKIRSNHYAKRLVLEGYDDVIWFGLPLWPPDKKKEVKP